MAIITRLWVALLLIAAALPFVAAQVPSIYNSKRSTEQRLSQLCPTDLTACPITSASGPTSDFECIDTTNELESCGGCASIGEGQDCTAIGGAWNVGCEQGTCAGKYFSRNVVGFHSHVFPSLYLRSWLQACR